MRQIERDGTMALDFDPEVTTLLGTAGKDGQEQVADKVDDVRRAIDPVEGRLESMDREHGNLATAVG